MTGLKGCLTNEEYKENEPLNRHTTFRIGGDADYYVVPQSTEALKKAISFCLEQGVPYYIIGKGSNILFADKGFRGVIIEIGKGMEKVEMLDEVTVRAEAGISLAKLASFLAERSLTGFEFASGIPGSLGGALVMNAGAYGGEMKDCVLEAVILDEQGKERILSAGALDLGYRRSVIQEQKYIVLSVTLSFEKGEREQILASMKELNQRRREKQPLEYPSAGSTFKRPPGYFAGKLVEDAGLRGYRVGDAQVSEKHCGFVVNRGKATAEEVLNLIKDVQEKVEKEFGVSLETEVRLIGDE